MKKLLKINIMQVSLLLAAFCLVWLTSCSDDKPDSPDGPGKEVGRTVLVYMLSSSNGLGEGEPYDYDLQDIDEMLEAASRGDITDGRLVVFHSASDGSQTLKEVTGDGLKTLRVYNDDLRPQTVARMRQVFADVKSVAPARDYGMVLWGHGSGWLQDGIADADDAQVSTQSYGGEHTLGGKGYWMNITSLATALQGQDLTFLYMDCCYMASVEVAYQLRDVVKNIVAYSTEVLGWGMPYDKNIKCFFSPIPDLVQAAQNTFDFYDAQVNQRYRMCAVSVLNTDKIEGLAAATRDIYLGNEAGYKANTFYQPFMTQSTSYYHDFGSYIHTLNADETQFEAFDVALADVVVYQRATERIWNILEIKAHSGLSTYIMPGGNLSPALNYGQLAWYQDVASALIAK